MLSNTGLSDLLQTTFACQIFQGCFALLKVFYILFLTEHKTNFKIAAGGQENKYFVKKRPIITGRIVQLISTFFGVLFCETSSSQKNKLVYLCQPSSDLIYILKGVF